jgi:methylphosphotriester-DNA--protein-cysteine methyltransferase
MKRTTTTEALAASRQHFLRRLLEQLDRTFTTEGQETALRVVTDLLERLDDDALRAYAYQHGIRSEDEFEEEAGPDRGTTPTQTG